MDVWLTKPVPFADKIATDDGQVHSFGESSAERLVNRHETSCLRNDLSAKCFVSWFVNKTSSYSSKKAKIA